MTPLFGKYSNYYNLLYRDKDYGAEAAFVHQWVQKTTPRARKILDIGCGTGKHAIELARLGYSVTGIDISPEMLHQAQEARKGLSPELASRLRFRRGDARRFRNSTKFDIVCSLFHVMSYQNSNADLLAAFKTARANLKPGGFFIFDFWYGPAVLSDLPQAREKRAEDSEVSVVRYSEPVSDFSKNTVDVVYWILVQDKRSHDQQELREIHRMRYLFQPEIEMFLELVGLKPIHFGEWMTQDPLRMTTFSGFCIAKFPNRRVTARVA